MYPGHDRPCFVSFARHGTDASPGTKTNMYTRSDILDLGLRGLTLNPVMPLQVRLETGHTHKHTTGTTPQTTTRRISSLT